MSFNLVSLGDVADVIDSLHKTPKYADKGWAMVRGTDVRYGYLELENTFKVDEVIYKEFSRRYCPKKDDIVITRVGSYGLTALVNDEVFCLGQNTSAIRPKINAKYLYLCLNSTFVQQQIESKVVGTTQKTLSLKAINSLLIPRFSTNQENCIANIGWGLNEKIYSNRKINQILEQMAQALFKSWFVDFEPVKAKMSVLEAGGSQADATLAAMTTISGKNADALAVFEREHPEQYAELKATAELFPSAMQESELGEIPEGWYVSDLSEVASLNAESWSKKNAPESVSYVDLANTKWGVINSIETYQFSDAPSRARRILKPHDTIVGTVRPGNGSYSYINKTGLTGSTGFAVLTPKARVFSEYIYLCVTSNESIERLAHLADGGAYPAVNADVVLSTQCVLPVERDTREAVLKVFSSRTDMFFSYRANGLSQNEILSNIRDTLLPKLLSGEITLPEAEQAVSEAENV
ncbi:restriction endonuclease subunit S [Enterobacter kobei]|uniref:restriction endonuclease subunit S n=1 Tax=Enterobacter kobei TaxID=208224 RepID=UPI002A7FED53|nr:restriction endonuclease subunit S [Enterobacter kobei]